MLRKRFKGKSDLVEKGEASELFGNERDKSFKVF